MRITKAMHDELRASGPCIAGDVVEAADDITVGLFQTKVLVTEGTRLIVRGKSGNALHPILVSKEADEHFTLAVSARDLRWANREVDRTEAAKFRHLLR